MASVNAPPARHPSPPLMASVRAHSRLLAAGLIGTTVIDPGAGVRYTGSGTSAASADDIRLNSRHSDAARFPARSAMIRHDQAKEKMKCHVKPVIVTSDRNAAPSSCVRRPAPARKACRIRSSAVENR